MRILIVGTYEPDSLHSMRLYASWLKRMLQARGHRVEIIRPRAFFGRLAGRNTLGKYLGYLDKFLLFPPLLRTALRRCDLVHLPDQGYAMYRHLLGRKPHLLTCHDVLAIRAAFGEFSIAPTAWTGVLLQRWILSGLRAAGDVVCVSHKTAADLRRLLAGPAPRIHVIHNPLNREYKPGAGCSSALAERTGIHPGDRYLFTLGGVSWYKNRIAALHILARLVERPAFADMKLVMAGRPLSPAMRAAIREEKIADHVIEVVDPTGDELEALYGQAAALLFPSLEEGFGWPILEAQACGCPVITSNRPPMDEVAGDAAIFIDPQDPTQAAAEIALHWDRRDALRERGLANLRRFDEARIAESYCSLYAAIPDGRCEPHLPVEGVSAVE
jgi:glycosyltransferase involved in cell wall biosynthesis